VEKKLKNLELKFKELYDVFEDRNKYHKSLDNLMDKLEENIEKDKELAAKIDATYIRSVFEINVFNQIRGKDSKSQFYTTVENVFSTKEYFYYFHLSKLNNFPDEYKLGYGVVKKWDSLPEEVKNECQRVMILNESPYPMIDDTTWRRLSAENKIIFNSPHIGQWLEISIIGVLGPNMQEEAFRKAELSLDFLRLLLFSGAVEPVSYPVIYDPKSNKVNLGGSISFTSGIDYIGDIRERGYDETIIRLNKLIDNPSKIEKRIIQALNFLRIGDYISEKQNKIFYYAAGIEKMILDNEPEISYKFSTRGAFLLENNSEERQIIFNNLKDVYKKRSEVAHGSVIEYDHQLTNKSKYYLKNMIKQLIKIIDENGLIDVKKSGDKKTLLNYVEQKMFPKDEK